MSPLGRSFQLNQRFLSLHLSRKTQRLGPKSAKNRKFSNEKGKFMLKKATYVYIRQMY